MLTIKIDNWLQNWPIEKKLYSVSLIFLSVFFLVPNNKILLLATVMLLLCLYALIKNLTHACLYVYMLLLPFQNGKGVDFLVVPPEYIYGNVPFVMTPTITMSSLMALLLLYLYIRQRGSLNSRSRSALHFPDALLGVFFITQVLSSLVSDIPMLSFLLSVQIWGYMFVYYYVVQRGLLIYIQSYFLPVISSLTLYEGFWSILQFLNKGPLGTWAENSIDPSLSTTVTHVASEGGSLFRMQGTFSHPNFLGYFMAFTIPVLLYTSVSKTSSRFMKNSSAVACVTGIIGLALSASRASWVVTVIAIALLFKFSRIRDTMQVTPAIRRFYLACVVLFSLLIPFLIIPRLSQLAITFDSSGGAQFRMELINYAIRIVSQNPFGVGLGMFPKILLQEIGGFTSFPTQPHNLFAQILAALGFLGAISFFGFLYLKLKESFASDLSFKAPHMLAARHVYRISLGGFLLLSMFYPILTEQQLFGWFWILILLII